MKKAIPILCILVLFFSCSTTKKPETLLIRDGTSLQKAIMIEEKNESAGIYAENEWIRDHCPGYRKSSQSLVFDKKRPYDIITIVNQEGDTKKVYFDISNFFGKF